ncbi:MAG TPA: proteasome assembly chaperone family protein [Methanomicrobia archaeon]|nr:putative ATP-dependent carboligase [Candidatus Alkanophaga volatiphilum]HDO64379.1 proteasome assembly chaperone family protein [Methanomicrobia archaeon]HEX59972.1 proteasome assembly chaperone family protein [Methanomicrobia archaeon]
MGEVRVVEEEEVKFEKPVVVEGLPDVGLVGTIAVSYLVDKLEFREIGYVESELFPPLMVVHDGELKNPVRIYGSDTGVLAILSEVAIPPAAVYPLTRALTDWFKERGVGLMVSITGLPVPNRIEIEEPEVVGIGNSKDAIARLKEKGIEVMLEGFIVGTYAVMLKECQKRGVPAVSLLAQCFPVYPDPGAAAAALRTLERLIGLEIELGELLEKAEEIKLKARDLMRQTSTSLAEMQKNMEQDLPIMYR